MVVKSSRISRWDDLQVFLAVAKWGSLSEAAVHLATDQSTVGRRLGVLESDLGAILFERTRTGCVLSPLGERVLDEARAMELSAHKFLDAVKTEDKSIRGHVKLALTEGMAIHFVIPQVLPRLMQLYPELSVELVTGTVPSNLVRHEADLALRFFRDTEGDLTVKKLGKLSRAVLVSRCLAPSLEGKPVEELPWIGSSLDALEGLWLREIGATRLLLSTPSYEAQLAAIRAGLGVGVSPTLLTDVMDDLITLGKNFPVPPPLDLYLVTRTSAKSTPRIRAVAKVIKEEMAELFRRDRLL